jgi:hypothetical protein
LRINSIGRLLDKDAVIKAMPSTLLALFLLQEHAKGESSFWHAYIQLLPQLMSIPLFYTRSDFSAIDGTLVCGMHSHMCVLLF